MKALLTALVLTLCAFTTQAQNPPMKLTVYSSGMTRTTFKQVGEDIKQYAKGNVAMIFAPGTITFKSQFGEVCSEIIKQEETEKFTAFYLKDGSIILFDGDMVIMYEEGANYSISFKVEYYELKQITQTQKS